MSKDKDIVYTSVWEYLEDIKILDNGTAKEIEQAKKEYWKIYRKNHKQKQREDKPEIFVAFSSKEEIEEFKALAKEHKKSLSKFIRESARAYAEKTYVQANEEQWEIIVQSIAMTQMAIHQIKEEIIEYGNDIQNYNLVLEKVLGLEYELENILNNPPLLEQSIQKTLKEKPWKKEVLQKLIEKA